MAPSAKRKKNLKKVKINFHISKIILIFVINKNASGMKVGIDFVGGWSIMLHDPQGRNRYHKGNIISAFRLPNDDLGEALLDRLVQIGADLTFEESYVFVMVKNSNIENIKFFL